MPTFNRKETLVEVLPSLAKQTYPADSYELLLSDSSSTDGTAEMVADMGIPNLRLITGENRGRSGARNRGIREAKGEIVLFTDADIIADPHLLEEHAKLHAAEPNVAVVGREIQVDTLEEYRDSIAHPERARHLHKRAQKELSWLFFLTGNASVRRDKLIEVGMFDEDFTGYGHEDLELGYRLMKSGVRIRHNPAAINYHWHPVPFDERLARTSLAGISTMRFYRKHRDPKIKLLMGVNPVTMALHSLLTEDRWPVPAWKANVEKSASCRELLTQFYYLNGVKAAIKDPNL
jgi:GT2 family glycosyltransferase